MERERTTIDITLPLAHGMACWEGSPGVELAWHRQLQRGDASNDTLLTMDVHTGTHVEAPLHVLAQGKALDAFPLERLVGPAYVADVGDGPIITASVLDASGIPDGTTRLLLKTRNTQIWRAHPQTFRKEFVGLDASGASWIVAHGVMLVGADYLSVAAFGHGAAVHRILCSADVLIVEGLALGSVNPGAYHATILPLSIPGAEAAPARAILHPITQHNSV